MFGHSFETILANFVPTQFSGGVDGEDFGPERAAEVLREFGLQADGGILTFWRRRGLPCD